MILSCLRRDMNQTGVIINIQIVKEMADLPGLIAIEEIAIIEVKFLKHASQ